MRRRFQGRVVLVTGASAGIGAALARELAAQGARLVLLARRVERLEALARELRARGAEVLVQSGDVRDAGQLDRAVESSLATFGALDVVVANAGFGVAGRFDALGDEDYARQFETNVFGVLRTTRATLPALRRSRGVLAVLGSVAGYVAAPGASPYAMSKFAIRAFAQALRGELHRDGVAVTLISPGFVDSEIRQVDNRGALHTAAPDPIPAWLRMRSDRAARIIVRAIARRRREVVITGHGKLLVVVARLAPWIFDFAARLGVRARREPRMAAPSREPGR